MQRKFGEQNKRSGAAALTGSPFKRERCCSSEKLSFDLQTDGSELRLNLHLQMRRNHRVKHYVGIDYCARPAFDDGEFIGLQGMLLECKVPLEVSFKALKSNLYGTIHH